MNYVRNMTELLGVGFWGLVVFACADDSTLQNTNGSPGCTPGEQDECHCSDGQMGFYTCNASGTGWGACDCSSGDADTDGDSDMDGDSDNDADADADSDADADADSDCDGDSDSDSDGDSDSDNDSDADADSDGDSDTDTDSDGDSDSDTDSPQLFTFRAGGIGEIDSTYADDFLVEDASIELTTVPTEYALDMRGLSYNEVLGSFAWVVSKRDTVIFIDNVQWSRLPPDESAKVDEENTTAVADSYADVGSDLSIDTVTDRDPDTSDRIPLPFYIDEYFSPSGLMGDGDYGNIDVAFCDGTPHDQPPRGHCFKFTYVVGDIGWGGCYFQYPQNNWGSEAGIQVEPGARSVRFTAWIE